MKSFLSKMAPKTLEKIIRDFGVNDDPDPVKALIEILRSYRLNIIDLRARYPELNNDKGLKR